MTYELPPFEQIERFNKLAEVIESRPQQFDMNQWIRPTKEQRLEAGVKSFIGEMEKLARFEIDMLAPHCGTAACIGGWAVTLWPAASMQPDIESAAQEILGLDDAVANWLFAFDAPHQEAHEAAEVLREMADRVADGDDLHDWVRQQQQR